MERGPLMLKLQLMPMPMPAILEDTEHTVDMEDMAMAALEVIEAMVVSDTEDSMERDLLMRKLNQPTRMLLQSTRMLLQSTQMLLQSTQMLLQPPLLNLLVELQAMREMLWLMGNLCVMIIGTLKMPK